MSQKYFFFLMFFIIIGSSSLVTARLNGSTATVVITDQQHDITSVTYPSTILTDETKDAIDVVSIQYGKDSNGNMTIILTTVGTPTPDNKTFYWVTLTSDNLTAWAWAGSAYSSSAPSSDCLLSCSWFIYNNAVSLDYTNNSAVISGKTITWTFPRQLSQLNYTTYDYDIVDVVLPNTPNATWEWDFYAWTGTSEFGSSQTSGTWWYDINDSKGSDTNSDSSGGVPGFEAVSLIAIISSTSFIVLNKRKKMI